MRYYKKDRTMRQRVLLAGLAAIAVFGFALRVGAQGPPPGDFGRRGAGSGPGGPMAGSFEFGGLVGGFGGRTVTGHAFQAKFTITRTQTLANNNTITNTTTGILARDGDGNTYRDVKLPGIGPWASSGKAQEFQYIKNLTTMMDYIVNVTEQTYEAFAIHPRNPPPGGNSNYGGQGRGPGKGPDSGGNPNIVMTNTKGTYTDPVTTTLYKVDDRKVTRTIPAGQIGNALPITITSERLYCPGLDLVVKETHSDPRFGSSTYQLANIVQKASVSFIPPSPPLQLVKGRGFGHRGGRRAGNQPPPPPGD
jgi:hypothetical protein